MPRRPRHPSLLTRLRRTGRPPRPRKPSPPPRPRHPGHPARARRPSLLTRPWHPGRRPRRTRLPRRTGCPSGSGALSRVPMSDAGAGPATGPDGLARCPWALSVADYLTYHDDEWGRPVRDDAGMFERLSLEAFQSGLSWLTILRKRENFRAAFRGFDLATVAAFGPGDGARLPADEGTVCKRTKFGA